METALNSKIHSINNSSMFSSPVVTVSVASECAGAINNDPPGECKDMSCVDGYRTSCRDQECTCEPPVNNAIRKYLF